jgi:hypothetical protein
MTWAWTFWLPQLVLASSLATGIVIFLLPEEGTGSGARSTCWARCSSWCWWASCSTARCGG